MSKFNLVALLDGHLDENGQIPFVGCGPDSRRPTVSNPLGFRYYNPAESILWLGKTTTIGEVINAAAPAWHTTSALGTPFSPGSVVPELDRPFTLGDTWEERSLNKAEGVCQIARALRMPNITFHAQVDVVDEANDDVFETGKRLEAVIPYWKETMERNGLGLLWGTANMFTNYHHILGSATSPNAATFEMVAIKHMQAIDATHACGGKIYNIWDGQGGEFDAIIMMFQTHFDQAASMLRKVVAYAKSKGITVMIEPKPYEPSMGQFHRDVLSTLYHIQQAGLAGVVGLNPEFDHAKLAMHDMCAEILRAGVMFWSVDINQGDLRVGYDVDRCFRDVSEAVYFWLCVARVGGFKNGGGCNFDQKPDVKSPGLLHLLAAYNMTLDALTAGLKIAVRIIEDGLLQDVVDAVYASAPGNDLLDDSVSLSDIKSGVEARGGKLDRPESLPVDVAHQIVASYVAEGVTVAA